MGAIDPDQQGDILFHFYWVVGANTKVGQEDMSEHRGVIYQ